MRSKLTAFTLSLVFLIAPIATAQTPLGSVFTYQGKLDLLGSPLNDTADFEFTLWDADVDGNMIDSTVSVNNVTVVDGLFTVEIDFGVIAFNGDNRWLEIAVRSPAGAGVFSLLSPRQPLTVIPYALQTLGLVIDELGNVTVAPGSNNSASGGNATVGGGKDNTASGAWSTVGGGSGNTASEVWATVGGGIDNVAGDTSTVGGGTGNVADGISTVGGGQNNTASGILSTVGGGEAHTASGNNSTVGGGGFNTASGSTSTVPGGSSNIAGGRYSFAAGRRARVRDAAGSGDADGDEGTFVWADSTNLDFESTGPDQFLIRASGGVGIGTTTPATELDVAGTATATAFVGDGSGLTNLPPTSPIWQANGPDIFYDAGNVGIGTTTPAEMLDVAGNIHSSGTITSGSSIIINGATDTITSNGDLELHVNDGRALRLETNATSPNLIGGYSGNSVTSGVSGATIGGGGASTVENRVFDDYCTIGGGRGNKAGSDDPSVHSWATVGGGQVNTASGQSSTVGGGAGNIASNVRSTVSGGDSNTAAGFQSAVGGGFSNSANATLVTIGGGQGNSASGGFATVGGGRFNVISADYGTIAGGGVTDPLDSTTANFVFDRYGTVAGGGNNKAGSDDGLPFTAEFATVGGGRDNIASGERSTVGGGQGNVASGSRSTVPGGTSNTAGGDYSFAAGRRAKANHTGAFVWGDSTDADVGSTAVDQFLIRAAGGVGIGTNAPSEQLTVAGKVESTSGGFKFPDGTVQNTAAQAVGVPIGSIMPFVGNPAGLEGSGWVLCDGSPFPKDTDAFLTSTLGANTPNLMTSGGIFLAGISPFVPGQTGGQSDIPSEAEHTHAGPAASASNASDKDGDCFGCPAKSVWLANGSALQNLQTGPGGAHDHGGENRPPYYGVMYIMRIN